MRGSEPQLCRHDLPNRGGFFEAVPLECKRQGRSWRGGPPEGTEAGSEVQPAPGKAALLILPLVEQHAGEAGKIH
jgi:hypothetical protein